MKPAPFSIRKFSVPKLSQFYKDFNFPLFVKTVPKYEQKQDLAILSSVVKTIKFKCNSKRRKPTIKC